MGHLDLFVKLCIVYSDMHNVEGTVHGFRQKYITFGALTGYIKDNYALNPVKHQITCIEMSPPTYGVAYVLLDRLYNSQYLSYRYI